MELKEFTYNNIKYEYVFINDIIYIYGFLSPHTWVVIVMHEDTYATISLKELAGLLDINTI